MWMIVVAGLLLLGVSVILKSRKRARESESSTISPDEIRQKRLKRLPSAINNEPSVTAKKSSDYENPFLTLQKSSSSNSINNPQSSPTSKRHHPESNSIPDSESTPIVVGKGKASAVVSNQEELRQRATSKLGSNSQNVSMNELNPFSKLKSEAPPAKVLPRSTSDRSSQISGKSQTTSNNEAKSATTSEILPPNSLLLAQIFEKPEEFIRTKVTGVNTQNLYDHSVCQNIIRNCLVTDFGLLLVPYILGCLDRCNVEPLTAAMTHRLLEILGKKQKTVDLWSESHNDDCLDFINAIEQGGNSTKSLLHFQNSLKSADSDLVTSATDNLLRAGLQRCKILTIHDAITTNSVINSIRSLLQLSNQFSVALSAILKEEAKFAQTCLGRDFESMSVLSPFTHVCILAMSKADKDFFFDIPNYPACTQSDISQKMYSIRTSTDTAIEALHSILLACIRHGDKENVLAWLAAVIRMCESRLGMNFKMINPLQATRDENVSASFAMGTVSTLLTFCVPFMGKDPGIIDIGYLHHRYRVDNTLEMVLSQGTVAGSDKNGEADDNSELFRTPAALTGKFNFSTEMFFLTARAIHVGLLPIIHEYHAQMQFYSRYVSSASGNDMLSANLPLIQKEQRVAFDIYHTALGSPELIKQMTMHIAFTRKWLSSMLQTNSPELKCIPEYMILDIAIWVMAITELEGTMSSSIGNIWSEFLEFGMLCLEHRDKFQRIFVPAAIIRSIEYVLESHERQNETRNSSTLLRSDSWGSMSSSSLESTFFSHPSTSSIVPFAIFDIYGKIDAIVGLDVDKPEYDLFNETAIRISVVKALLKLLGVPRLYTIFESIAQTPSYGDFAKKMCQNLLFFLEDGLLRISNARQMELTLTDNNGDSMEKQQFLKMERNAARGQMQLTRLLLDVVLRLTASNELSHGFVATPTHCSTHASVFIRFLNLLCGPKRKMYKISNMEEIGFQPLTLVGKSCQVLVRLAVERDFLVALTQDSDWDMSVMNEVISLLNKSNELDSQVISSFNSVAKKVASLRQASIPNTGAITKRLSLPQTAIDDPAIVAKYLKLFEDFSQVDSTSFLVSESSTNVYAHACHNVIESEVDPLAPKHRKLMKELQSLQSANGLPLHPSSSIFIRHDDERTDVLRAMITGPEGTPYFGGCYFFDIYIPPTYPAVPPVVKFITTANGTVRFNPNLYNDGKVCLSLLGTWHGGSQSEKWDPNKSSIYQILVSIQALILIPNPLQNEPGYESFSATPEGISKSKSYNSTIAFSNIRSAILGNLVNAPAGFLDLVKKHVAMVGPWIVKEAEKWKEEWVEGESDSQKWKNLIAELTDAVVRLREEGGFREDETQMDTSKSG